MSVIMKRNKNVEHKKLGVSGLMIHLSFYINQKSRQSCFFSNEHDQVLFNTDLLEHKLMKLYTKD